MKPGNNVGIINFFSQILLLVYKYFMLVCLLGVDHAYGAVPTWLAGPIVFTILVKENRLGENKIKEWKIGFSGWPLSAPKQTRVYME